MKTTIRYFSREERVDELFLVARVLMTVLFGYSGLRKLSDFSRAVAYMTSTKSQVPTFSVIFAQVMPFVVGIAIALAFTHARLPFRTSGSAFTGHHPWTMRGVEQ